MKRVYFLVSAIAMVLTACGGGSDGGSAPPPSVPPPPNQSPITVTSANSKPAVRVAYGATMQSVGTGDLVGGSGLASSPGGYQKPGVQSSIPGVLGRVVQGVPLGPDSYDCGVSGFQTISGDLANPLTLSVGDRINVDATNCDDGLGEVINGRMEMTVALFSGDILSGLYLMEMDVLLIDFRVTTATNDITSNGDSRVSIDTSGTPMLLLGISGTSLTNVSTAAGTETMTGFDTSQSVNTGTFPEPYTLASSGRVNSSQLTGYFDYATPVTFQGAGGAYPFAGEMLITGEGGGTIRLIALDEVNVRIETDVEGDGTVDSTEDTTWDDIAGTGV